LFCSLCLCCASLIWCLKSLTIIISVCHSYPIAWNAYLGRRSVIRNVLPCWRRSGHQVGPQVHPVSLLVFLGFALSVLRWWLLLLFLAVTH
jgi:hypothetical protein